MDTLTTGMSAIRAAQILGKATKSPPNDLEAVVVNDALELVTRIIGATVYLESGTTEGLQDDAIVEARYARAIAKQLNSAGRKSPALREYLTRIRDGIEQYLHHAQEIELADLQTAIIFLSAIGKAMIITHLSKNS